VKPGQHVVITAASSSVGIAAIGITNALGAVSIATTTSPHKVDALREIGAANVINTKSENYVERVREITGSQGPDVVFDSVAGAMMNDHVRLIKQGGWIFVYGVLDTLPMQVNPGVIIGKGAFLHGHSIMSLYQDPAGVKEAVETVNRWLDEGKLRFIVDRRYPLAEIQAAYSRMQSNEQLGKIIVNP
jgi:NADPH:quinone reductase-like Zn-dependent oxidoreductase